jgi:hypothetical protein
MVLHDEQFPVIVRSDAPLSLIKSLMAASRAHRIRSKSLDRVRQRYCTVPKIFRVPPPEIRRYREARALVQDHVDEHRDLLRLTSGTYPSPGRNSATVAMVRLGTSFGAALILIRSGLHYEATAVTRLIIEQLAWCVTVADLHDMAKVDSTQPQACVTALKQFVPEAGKLYGLLSEHTHMGLSRQFEYVQVSTPTEATRVMVRFGLEYLVAADLLLTLADAYAMVAEYLVREDMSQLRSIRQSGAKWLSSPDRPFAAKRLAFSEKYPG